MIFLFLSTSKLPVKDILPGKKRAFPALQIEWNMFSLFHLFDTIEKIQETEKKRLTMEMKMAQNALFYLKFKFFEFT